jgi:hypothetical protein
VVKKLYLDGCSLTYGEGLSRNQNLGYFFQHEGEYIVDDMSRSGKSNLAICLDTYQKYQDFDVFVLGFTFSSRFGIKYQDQNIDLFAGSHGLGFNLKSEDLDLSTRQVYKYFYSVFGRPYCDDLSDMLIDTTVSFLLANGKKVIPFSWETRQTKNDLFYPYYGPHDRLEDGHLNAVGTKKLYQQLGVLIDQQQR